jgi:hemoglobin-like flavoprotein
MLNHMNNFSSTEIHILENGLRWIKETNDSFGNKFYHRLLREHPEVKPFLQSIDPWSFNKDFVQSLDAIIGEIRTYGEVISPLNDFWPELSSIAMDPLEPSKLINVAETFLDLIAELAEDAWCPTLEYAWRKAIKTVITVSWEPGAHSFYLSDSKSFLYPKGNIISTAKDRIFCFGAMMVMAACIAALGLLSRGHIVENRSKGREPLRLSVCS